MAAAPYGSSLILPISYAYISMMGSEGLTEVSKGLGRVGSPGCTCMWLWVVRRVRHPHRHTMPSTKPHHPTQ